MMLMRSAATVLAVLCGSTWTGSNALARELAHEITPVREIAPELRYAGKKPTQYEVDQFGWRMLTAFSWPAKPGERGVPDPDRHFGAPGPVVWETWKSPNEVFLPDGSKPAPWEVYGTPIPKECYDAGARGDGSTPGLMIHTLVNRTSQAAGGSLTDQNGNLVYYSITFNRDIFDFIYDNGYYNVVGQEAMKAAVDYPAGTAEMKAAWRILLPEESEEVKERLFRRTYYVYTPASGEKPASCGLKELGVIGLHFNLKVAYPDGSTQWLMATFEQVDNVPPFKTPYEPGEANHPLPYSLFNKKCYTQKCIYNQSTEQGRPQSQPVNAIRVVDIDPEARKLNPLWQEALADTPWTHYEQITTQYPAKPTQPPLGLPTPALSANTTMETYVRQSSCLNCHYTARDISETWWADYSFMLAQACPKPLFPNHRGEAQGYEARRSAACTPTKKNPATNK